MASTFDIGTDSNEAQDDLIELSFEDGATVTVKNVAGGTVNYYFTLDEGSPDGTITVGNSQAFTGPPVWIDAAGRTTVTVTSSAADSGY